GLPLSRTAGEGGERSEPGEGQAAIGVVTQEHIGRIAPVGDDDQPPSAARLALPTFWLNSRLESVAMVTVRPTTTMLSPQRYTAVHKAIARRGSVSFVQIPGMLGAHP